MTKRKIGLPLPTLHWWRNDAGYIFSTQYLAFYDYLVAQSIDPPDLDERIVTDSLLFRPLSALGVFAQLDQWTNGYGYPNDRLSTLVNLKAPGTRNHSLQTDANFNRPYGFGRFAAVGNRINSNFIPSTHGVNYTQNDCSIIFYVPFDYAGNSADEVFGGGNAAVANSVDIQLRSATNVLTYRVNNATAITVAGVTLTKGLWMIQRTASNAVKVFKDGVQVGSTSTVASTGLSSVALDIGAYNGNGTHSSNTTKYISFWMLGASHAGKEAAISTIFYAYKTAIDALVTTPTMPVFPDYTSVSNDLANYLSVIGGLKSSVPNSKLVWEYQTGIGAIHSQGCSLGGDYLIYSAAGNATSAWKITPSSNPYNVLTANVATLTAQIQKYGGNKHLGDYVYDCPFNATAIKRYQVSTGTTTYWDTTGAVAADNLGNLTGAQKWWGWYQASDGLLYGLAYDATECIVLNPATMALYFLDTTGVVTYGAGNLSGPAKADSGEVVGKYVYGGISTGTTMMRINIEAQNVSFHGSFPVGINKWGISKLLPNGKLLQWGYNRTDVIVIDLSDFSYTTSTGPALAGITGCCKILANGDVVTLPIGHTRIYKYDYLTNTHSIAGTLPSAQSYNSLVETPDGKLWGLALATGQIITLGVNKKTFALSDNHVFSRYINEF